MTEDKLLDLVTGIAPRHEFIDPETGIKDFNVLGFSRELASAAEAAAIERCAKYIDCPVTDSGTVFAKAIRALLPKEE